MRSNTIREIRTKLQWTIFLSQVTIRIDIVIVEAFAIKEVNYCILQYFIASYWCLL